MTTASITRTNVDHALNCWQEHFDAIKAGLKTSEVRRTDDRANIMPGDTLTLLCTDKESGLPLFFDDQGLIVAQSPAERENMSPPKGSKVRKLRVLVTHKTDVAGELAIFGVKIADFNRPSLMVPCAVLSITVIE